MRILFFGTPYFAEVVLKKLIKKHTVVGVVCQNDKPANRGKKMVSPNIKTLAESLGIKVFQFERLLDNLEEIKSVACDIFVTASSGKILSTEVLDVKM